MSESEYEEPHSETVVLQARIHELEASLARQVELRRSTENDNALLGLATAALAEEGDEHTTACDDIVGVQSSSVGGPISDVTQREVVVGTAVSAQVPAAAVALSSAGEVDCVAVAGDWPSTSQVGMLSNAHVSTVRRPGRSKVRFSSVCRSEYSATDSDNELGERGNTMKHRSLRSSRSYRSLGNDRPEVHIRGREGRWVKQPEHSQ